MTKSDYIIFEKESSKSGKRNFIVQIGKQNIISIGDLGIEHEFGDTLDKVMEIIKSSHKYVEYTTLHGRTRSLCLCELCDLGAI